jgi:hypothetical protein
MEILTVNKIDMVNVAGKIYNLNLPATYVQDVISNHGVKLKFSYNNLLELLSVVHFPDDYDVLTITYLPKN